MGAVHRDRWDGGTVCELLLNTVRPSNSIHLWTVSPQCEETRGQFTPTTNLTLITPNEDLRVVSTTSSSNLRSDILSIESSTNYSLQIQLVGHASYKSSSISHKMYRVDPCEHFMILDSGNAYMPVQKTKRISTNPCGTVQPTTKPDIANSVMT